MPSVLYAVLIVGGLFVGLLAAQEIGVRLGRRHLSEDDQKARAGLGAVEGAVFGLMGLMIAFTFSGASERFEARRHLVVEESNAIGTAYLRLDVLPVPTQPKLRDLFRRYTEARIAVYRKLPDILAAKEELAAANGLQGEIWAAAVEATREAPGTPVLVLPALNAMFDITISRTVALRTHPPPLVFVMLGFLSLACALLAGYGMAGSRARSWLHVVAFAAILTATVYVILDYEFPRVGIIRLDAMDRLLVDVRESMR